MSNDGWIRWLCDLVKPGADALRAEVAGEPVRGLGNRSVGCRVATPDALRWMRVITKPTQWAGGPAWTVNTDANAITNVAKPVVLDVAEWDESGRRIRAELMTLAPGTQISADMVLRQHIDLDHRWWSDVHWANLTAPRCWILDWES